MSKVANNVAKFIISRSFTRAEYIDYKDDDRTGTILIDVEDGQKLKIFRVSIMDWLSLYCNTTDDEVYNLMKNHGFCFKK